MTKLSRLVFANGPVQNGDFTFAARPGKATGIRIAAALNELAGAVSAPHLWNTVTLAGDKRHRTRRAADPTTAPRAEAEQAYIHAKYQSTAPPPAILTDADEAVASLALAMLETRLAAGLIDIRTLTVRICSACDHLLGLNGQLCRACGSEGTRPARSRQLVVDRAPTRPALDGEDMYSHARRQPTHLRAIANNVPGTLLLSRTRDHGIDLAPLGLPGLVLDPRAGLHITALAAAHEQVTDIVMTVTANALANIAAYGQLFRAHNDCRLRYAVHGFIPYDQLTSLQPEYRAKHLTAEQQATFETWFLPLSALKDKSGIPASQLRGLFTHFHRASLRQLADSEETKEAIRESIHDRISIGDPNWITDKTALATAMALTARAGSGSGMSAATGDKPQKR